MADKRLPGASGALGGRDVGARVAAQRVGQPGGGCGSCLSGTPIDRAGALAGVYNRVGQTMEHRGWLAQHAAR